MEAWGTPGARRTRSLACKNRKHTSIVATDPPENPAFPHAMVLTVSFVISSVIGLCCHRRLRFVSADLTPASRRQDHTTSPSALVPFVSDTSASIASRPASVTIAIRPFGGTRPRDYCGDLPGSGSKFFCRRGLDDPNHV